jgi:hypothetical protein
MGDEYTYPPSKSQPEVKSSHNLEQQLHSNQMMWDQSVRESPLNRLRYYDALLARGVDINRERVAELVREAGAVAVLSDPDAIGLVRQLWGEKAIMRLKDRARASA